MNRLVRIRFFYHEGHEEHEGLQNETFDAVEFQFARQTLLAGGFQQPQPLARLFHEASAALSTALPCIFRFGKAEYELWKEYKSNFA